MVVVVVVVVVVMISWCRGVRGGGGDDDGVVEVENLVEMRVNFGEEKEEGWWVFVEIGGGGRLLEVEGSGGVKRRCWGVSWVA